VGVEVMTANINGLVEVHVGRGIWQSASAFGV
jgi:hypothetical protein